MDADFCWTDPVHSEVGQDQGDVSRLSDHRVVSVDHALVDSVAAMSVDIADDDQPLRVAKVPKPAKSATVDLYVAPEGLRVDVVEVNDPSNDTQVTITVGKEESPRLAAPLTAAPEFSDKADPVSSSHSEQCPTSKHRGSHRR